MQEFATRSAGVEVTEPADTSGMIHAQMMRMEQAVEAVAHASSMLENRLSTALLEDTMAVPDVMRDPQPQLSQVALRLSETAERLERLASRLHSVRDRVDL